MRYKEFFRITIDHRYFSPGESAELVFVPDPSTQRFLKGQHFIIKAMINGIKVLIPVNEGDSIIPVLQADDVFTFNIFPTSNTFHAFTDMPDLAEGEILSFTNTGLSAEETQLVSSIATDSGALNGFPPVVNAVIRVGDTLFDGTAVPEASRYNIVLNSKAVKWRYYFISDPETTDLSIQDGNGQLIFNSVALQNDTTDKIIISLRFNFPDANLFLFESETPVAFQSQAVKKLQLVRHEDIIINHLPNPDIKDGDFKIINIHK